MLIVQDDTGLVANANSYVSFGTACAYMADRVYLPSFSDAQIEDAIIAGMNEVEAVFPYLSEKLAGESQTTKFPRLSGGGIPEKIKSAVCEYAIYYLTQSIAMVGYIPEESYRDKYTKLTADEVAEYVLSIEESLADGKLYVSVAEDNVYRSDWITLNE